MEHMFNSSRKEKDIAVVLPGSKKSKLDTDTRDKARGERRERKDKAKANQRGLSSLLKAV